MTYIKRITESKYFLAALGLIGCLIAASVIFAAGVGVGLHKARYSYQWGENYERNFAGGPDRMMRPGGPERLYGPENFFPGGGKEMRNANGVAGEIVSINENMIVIKDRNNKENTVSVEERTIIKNGRNDIKIGDLKNNDRVVVIGRPVENGVVVADLIRVFNEK
ncbi:MAG: hypothetical protein US25_C0018G0009 [Candidatus Moranbacteria bacterium GW2011_GWE1_36_7]|nr:MAG: hypothetical protein UR99_C0028G0004 [Candidatus Moranbacteria bacterium GW2011_GWD2_36_12]KKQ05995.1 MAG: hypothetical protein US16_C0028G0008 [Candidatus Moranbacteria bacterium GW2011_GWE2_36_40]KKQ14873.1 MAG: hypothetical protein US25_C0018G0009 [Candidatus Moranbacteria bacterium GW2011_GWE1_36_7]